MTEHSCDVAIIGAGTAGLSALRAARGNGAKTLLIDPAFSGTVCATVGCMPSKLLIAAAAAAHAVRRAPVFGITPTVVAIDGPAVMARVRAERDTFVAATIASINDLPPEVRIQARARFTGPNSLALDNGDTVQARAIVIATGSAPMIPDAFKRLGDLALTNRNLFDQTDLPSTLAVIGGGAIGLELAQAMGRLGVKTVLLDSGSTLGGAQDDTVQSAVLQAMGQVITVHLGVAVTAAREGDQARLTWTGNAKGSALFDRVLIATGRPPQHDGLDLHQTGLALDDHGTPEFSRDTLQCGTSAIFVAGDANADAPVLHEASNEGAIAGRNAACWPNPLPALREPAFSLIFTDPPLATIGDPPDGDSVTGTADYTDQGRAKVEARATGLVQIHAAKPNGRLTGATLFAPGADHMAHLLIWAIRRGETASSLLEMPFYHPTLEEGLKPALRAICKATSSPLPQDQDTGNAPGV